MEPPEEIIHHHLNPPKDPIGKTHLKTQNHNNLYLNPKLTKIPIAKPIPWNHQKTHRKTHIEKTHPTPYTNTCIEKPYSRTRNP